MRSTLSPEERKEMDDLKARNDKLSAALYETRNEDIPLSPQNNSQNIPLPLEQSPLQVHPAPLPLEQSLPLNIMQPVSEQMTGLPRTPRSPSPETVNANNLTMQQALELFELLQARKTKDVEKTVMVDAEPVARAPARAEPLSYLTLGTVEGIIASTNPDVLQEQTSSWEGKVEKYMRLSHTYSSDNTISGEKCYMVDEALYKDILLAVAARKQNESTISSASEKLEQHLVQIEDSHKRIIQRENVVIEQFVAEIALSQEKIRLGHTARMQAVMADIRTLKDSVASTSVLDQNSPEMKRLRFQVTQYESIIPVYQSRLKDTEDLNRKLDSEKNELSQNIERLRQKLNKAESLVFSMGTPESIRQREPGVPVMGSSAELFPRLFPPSSRSGQNKVGAADGTVPKPAEPVDLSVSPPEPSDTIMETSTAPVVTSAAPVIKLTFKEVISSVQKQNNVNKEIARASEQPTPPKLITLSNPGSRTVDTMGKRTRSLGAVASEPAQKKPPQNSYESLRERVVLSSDQLRVRNHDKEKEVEEEVKKSCQNIQWTRGPLPKDIDHWFYDLRTAGTIPPASLVAASRAMVIKWKNALGGDYFPYRSTAGAAVVNLEHAHRTFNALTKELPISGWVSRACAKHQGIHERTAIPLLVARDGDPLTTRPCPLIYYYEQLLEDLKHIVTHMFEPIPRTIVNPIPEAQRTPPARRIRSAPIASSTSMVSANEQPPSRKQLKKRFRKKAPSSDEYFQELAKDMHESNKSISNPYEQHDTEQYNWAFDSLLSDEKKDMIRRAKRMISLIKATDPPKNYILRRMHKLAGEARDWNEGLTMKEYDDEAVFELEQFIDDISTNNADKHIVGYYEDRVGTYKNIEFSDGPSGQGPF